MAIVVLCPHCRTRLTLGDDRAGETFDCPRCGKAITVPLVVSPPPPPRPAPPPLPPAAPPVPSEDAPGHGGDWSETALGVGCLVLIAIGVGVLWYCAGWGVGLGSTIVLLVWLVVGLYDGWQSRCLKCGGWWGVELTERVKVGEEQCYGMVTRTARTSGGGYVAGRPVHASSSTSWEERVPIIRTTYRLTWRCNRCGHETYTQEVHDAEDFSRS
jgi:ribosomal protein L37E